MLFSAPVFIFLFLPLTLLLFYSARKRNFILLLASLFFYAWGENLFVILLLVSAGINYCIGLLIDDSQSETRRRVFLTAGICLNLIVLVVFKYAAFLIENLNSILLVFSLPALKLPSVHLPLGISFFTFQAISYIVDLYRKEVAAQRNFFSLALYICMFPQLIAGPIVRYHQIEKALNEKFVNLNRFALGVERFIIGLAKKVILADGLALLVDPIFALPSSELTFTLAWTAVIGFSLQIFFDFSGYSDMAIGLGRMFGFRLPENFSYPYISKSIREFWRRWHISLSSWFRDYLYIPLGGNRLGAVRTCVNLFLVFFLCGLWHGASWNFVIWGMIHGLFLVLERSRLGVFIQSLSAPIQHLYALFIVTTSWVFFRSESLDQALNFLSAMFGVNGFSNALHPISRYVGPYILLLLVVAILISMPLKNFARRVFAREGSSQYLRQRLSVQRSVKYSLLVSLLILSIASIATQTLQTFIYFRF
ncbi:MAG: MBOAT family protein [Candidatus Nitrohelix vancouverensis]|uniref:MBOAT family protein n=1 Tax=Candidatus Nitrohelix vancouverensis TaxID=2705534 RepID=A0A7T0C2J7_9BACT|nr:MAG: MBOAT family protein [Candidatus Nitrohelix vancouverensis]